MADWGTSRGAGSIEFGLPGFDDEVDRLDSVGLDEIDTSPAPASPMRYRAVLHAGKDKLMGASGFWLSEAYNTGWSGTALISWDTRDSASDISAATMLATLFYWGFGAGQQAVLEMVTHAPDSVAHDMVSRAWPCHDCRAAPGRARRRDPRLRPSARRSGQLPCSAHRVGAYAESSAAEIVGGVISLAAGGDGKPTASVSAPGLPRIDVEAAYRDALSEIPYALAVGQTFGEWLAAFTSMLGLRAELIANRDDPTFVTLRLTDERANGLSLEMGVVDTAEDTTPVRRHGPIAIRGHAAFPPGLLRSALLDDPTAGTARRLIRSGPVGEIVTSEGADVDEARLRSFHSLYGSIVESLLLQSASRCTRMRPGAVVEFDREIHGIDSWQVASVQHLLAGAVYNNDATLMRSDLSWHPPAFGPSSPFMVSAIVDHGLSVDMNQPVPRDRIGRVKVRFPFIPSPVGEEHAALLAGDTDEDGRVELDDFSDDERAAFETGKTQMDDKLARYRSGEFDDPYPGVEDADLTPEQLLERTSMRVERTTALRYLAYQGERERDRQDRDRDGAVTARDAFVSSDLEAALRDPKRREKLLSDATAEDANESADPLVIEYRKIFLSRPGDGNETDSMLAAASQDAGDDSWPPGSPFPSSSLWRGPFTDSSPLTGRATSRG